MQSTSNTSFPPVLKLQDPQINEKLEECIKFKDYGPIVKNSELFLAALFNPNYFFDLSDKIQPTKELIEDVEKIRYIFKRNYYSLKDFALEATLWNDNKYYITEKDYIETDGPPKDQDTTKNIVEISCYSIIGPILEKLSCWCGASFRKLENTVTVLGPLDTIAHDTLKKVFAIQWQSFEEHSMPRGDKIRKILYAEYVRQENCSCTLILKSGTRLKVHVKILEEFSTLLKHSIKTDSSPYHIIYFENYSDQVIRIAIDSLYLDPKAFKEKYVDIGLPFPEVLAFSNEYDLGKLYSICISIICETAKAEDVDNIREWNKVFKNHFLYQLIERLETP